MTTKHTPAPWEIQESAITTISGCTLFIEDSCFDEETRKANLQLIAAAPNLLEVLQMMADKDFEFSEYECRLARMVIAKATGGIA
jgi:hypothetical protein